MLSSTFRKISKASVFLFLLITGTWVHAAITDIKFGQYQIADSQWNVSACLNTTTCQIYSKNPGTAYKIPWTSGQVQWAAGDYVQFELSGNASFPYVAKQYSSNGTLKSTLGTGKIVNMGPDYFFFVGNDNNTGQLFSGSSGMSDTSGVTWTGTLNPTLAEADEYAANNYSTTPLAPGETATTSSPPPPPPEPVFSSAITGNQADRRTAAFSATTGNQADVMIQGNNNIVTVEQIGPGHYSGINILGNTNTVSVNQISSTGRHYSEATVIGDRNSVNVIQQDNNKSSFAIILGNDNTAIIDQRGSGTHYANLEIEGNGHRALISQRGSGGHNATVSLSGSQPWDFELYQDGATGRTYSLPHGMTDGSTVSGHCATVGGCVLIVNQQ